VSATTFKLGRRSRIRDARVPHYSALLAGTTPPVSPPSLDYTKGMPTDLGMMLNDSEGDCLTEGTLVNASDVSSVYRAKYSGPVVRLTLRSGKRLAVTPNHAILTPRGFVRARCLKEGDYLVGTSRPEILPDASARIGKRYLNQAPAPVEQIFSSGRFARRLARKVMPVSVDFHGDERFVNGKIDIVRPNGFLGREQNAALRQPNSEHQVSSAGKLQGRFHRAGSALQALGAGLLSLLGDMSLGDLGSPLVYGHAGPAQPNYLRHFARLMAGVRDGFTESPSRDMKLPHESGHVLASQVALHRLFRNAIHVNLSERAATRPNLYAGKSQPAVDGLPTDSKLFGNLFDAFPGLVQLDRVINVETDEFSGHIYDLSTKSHWYSANGIITHNCAEAAYGHFLQIDSFLATGSMLTLPDASIQALAITQGLDPSNPGAFQGTVLQSLLSLLVKTGITMPDGSVQKLFAFVEIDPRNDADLNFATYQCGALYCGSNIPKYLEAYFAPGSTWDVEPSGDQTSAGGHCWLSAKYRPVTAGRFQRGALSWGSYDYEVTPPFWDQNVDECYALLSPEAIARNGGTFAGLTIPQWEEQMQAVREAA
jgi:hypothetical protein